MPLDTDLKQMTIAEVLAKYPQTLPVFEKFGLHTYAATQTAKYENLEASAIVHTLSLPSLLKSLTEAIEA